MRSFLKSPFLYSLAFNKKLTIMIREARLQKCIYITTPLEWLFVLGIAILVIQQNFLFSCLFGVFRPTSRFLHSYKDVTIIGEVLQILTYARHSWPLKSDGLQRVTPTMARGIHSYWSYEDPWHSHLLRSVLTVDLSLPTSVCCGSESNTNLPRRTLLPPRLNGTELIIDLLFSKSRQRMNGS